MSTCVFCRQPLGLGGSACLYHREDTGAEGRACPHCQELLRRRGFGCASPAPAVPQGYRPPRAPVAPQGYRPSGTPAASQDQWPQIVHSHPQAALPAASRVQAGAALAPSPRQNPWDPTRRDRLSHLLDSPPSKPDAPSHSPWIVGMKIFAWLLFAATVAAIYLWGSQSTVLMNYFPSTAVFAAALVLVALIAGLLMISLLMVLLNLARDVRLLRIGLTEGKER